MPLIQLVVMFIAIGVLLWLVNNYIIGIQDDRVSVQTPLADEYAGESLLHVHLLSWPSLDCDVQF